MMLCSVTFIVLNQQNGLHDEYLASITVKYDSSAPCAKSRYFHGSEFQMKDNVINIRGVKA